MSKSTAVLEKLAKKIIEFTGDKEPTFTEEKLREAAENFAIAELHKLLSSLPTEKEKKHYATVALRIMTTTPCSKYIDNVDRLTETCEKATYGNTMRIAIEMAMSYGANKGPFEHHGLVLNLLGHAALQNNYRLVSVLIEKKFPIHEDDLKAVYQHKLKASNLQTKLYKQLVNYHKKINPDSAARISLMYRPKSSIKSLFGMTRKQSSKGGKRKTSRRKNYRVESNYRV